MRRGPDFGVAAAEVDDRRTGLGGGLGDAPEQGDEVLLGQALDAGRAGAHESDGISSAPLAGQPARGKLADQTWCEFDGSALRIDEAFAACIPVDAAPPPELAAMARSAS